MSATAGLSIKGQALRYLAQREHSRAELERKLMRALTRPPRPARTLRGEREKAGDAAATDLGGAGPRAAVDAVDVFADADNSLDADDAAQAKKQALQQDIASTLDELSAEGFLSDERTAVQLLTSKAPRFGVNRLRREMQLKGLDGALISSTLAQAKSGELAHAREVWRRKFGALPVDAKGYGKQMRFLAGRGFSSTVIQRILRDHGDADD